MTSLYNDPARDLAGGDPNFDSYTPFQLFAGEKPVTTDYGLLTAGTVYKRYTVLARTAATGKLVPWVPGGSGGAGVAIGVLAQPCDTSGTGTNADTSAPFYTGGFFNFAALVVPSGATMLELQVLWDRGTLAVGTLDTTGQPPTYS
jgi:hypothetical protein